MTRQINPDLASLSDDRLFYSVQKLTYKIKLLFISQSVYKYAYSS